MKKTRFIEAQISGILTEFDADKNILDVVREYRVATAMIYNLKAKYVGMKLNDINGISDLVVDNPKLKHLYAGLADQGPRRGMDGRLYQSQIA